MKRFNKRPHKNHKIKEDFARGLRKVLSKTKIWRNFETKYLKQGALKKHFQKTNGMSSEKTSATEQRTKSRPKTTSFLKRNTHKSADCQTSSYSRRNKFNTKIQDKVHQMLRSAVRQVLEEQADTIRNFLKL